MKKALVTVCLLVAAMIALVCLSGHSAVAKDKAEAPEEKRVTSAKIRYFDGSLDTVLLTSYSWLGNSDLVILHTDEGRKIILDGSNMMIIEESEAQYNCVE